MSYKNIAFFVFFVFFFCTKNDTFLPSVSKRVSWDSTSIMQILADFGKFCAKSVHFFSGDLET